MIPKEQLRIGNLVVLAHESNWPEHVVTITELLKDKALVNGYRFYSYEDLMPIELNKDWLINRLGFEDNVNNIFDFRYSLSIGNNTYIISDGNNFWAEKVVDNKGHSIGTDGGDKLHQLQNIFHSLTGKELTIKEPINEEKCDLCGALIKDCLCHLEYTVD